MEAQYTYDSEGWKKAKEVLAKELDLGEKEVYYSFETSGVAQL